MTLGPRPALVIGVVALTWSALFVRWADAPPLAIAFLRMALAAAGLLAIAGVTRTRFWRAWRGTAWWTGAAAALLLAIHLALWIASLAYTTVAASVVLVCTQPVFVALLGWIALRERPARAAWVGMGLALAGTMVIAGGDVALDRRALFGDMLALLAALVISGYYVLGRHLRATTDLLPYVVVVFSLAAAWLGLAVAAAGVPIGGYDATTWAALAGLAIVPTIIGHSAMNFALRYLRAYEVNVAILGEPVGATLWAALLLAELPGPATVVGGTLILGGILLTMRRRSLPDAIAPAPL
ncbi:MAG: DMT family transporter [Gemmatimonadota bacterium]